MNNIKVFAPMALPTGLVVAAGRGGQRGMVLASVMAGASVPGPA